MRAPYIATGKGYEDDSTFDGFTVISEPVAKREDRVWDSRDGRPGVTYESHSLKLATNAEGRGFYLLIQHGGGRRVLKLKEFYDGGAMFKAVLAMPEREQYALLYTLYCTAEDAAQAAQAETSAQWAQAFADKRIKKRRKGGALHVELVEAWRPMLDGAPVPGHPLFKEPGPAMDFAKAAAGEGQRPTAQSYA